MHKLLKGSRYLHYSQMASIYIKSVFRLRQGLFTLNLLWGSSPEKLYHSYMVFDTKQRIGALVKGKNYYVRVDAFNENGITEGTVKQLTWKTQRG